MNAFLLYSDREWVGNTKYFDSGSIVQDLGLKTLFMNAGKDVEFENGAVKKIKEQDHSIRDTKDKEVWAGGSKYCINWCSLCKCSFSLIGTHCYV